MRIFKYKLSEHRKLNVLFRRLSFFVCLNAGVSFRESQRVDFFVLDVILNLKFLYGFYSFFLIQFQMLLTLARYQLISATTRPLKRSKQQPMIVGNMLKKPLLGISLYQLSLEPYYLVQWVIIRLFSSAPRRDDCRLHIYIH